LLVAVSALRRQIDIGLNVKAFIFLRAEEIFMRERTGIEGEITAFRDDLACTKTLSSVR
jgi:hypothetical protein